MQQPSRPVTTLAFPRRFEPKPGKQIAEELKGYAYGPAREDYVQHLVLDGCVPAFMRETGEVILQSANPRIAVEVAPDYLCLGTDEDYLVWPVAMTTAQRIADFVGGVLPTRGLVNAIYKAAEIKPPAQPWSPPRGVDRGSNMLTASRWIEQAYIDAIARESIREEKKLGLGALVAGYRKDYVVGIPIKPQNTAIYGWFTMAGFAIQGPDVQSTFHEASYVDYSHGARLVFGYVHVDDYWLPYSEALVRYPHVFGASDAKVWRHPAVEAPQG